MDSVDGIMSVQNGSAQHSESDEFEFSIDLPKDREYPRPEDAELDAALVEAIKKANQAGNDYLSQVLEYELGSHYYEHK